MVHGVGCAGAAAGTGRGTRHDEDHEPPPAASSDSDVHGLILAGGFGSRLAADGVATAKATVSVGGVPQVVRLVRTLLDLDCSTVVCAVRTGVELPPLTIAPGKPSTVTVRRCAT